MKKRFMTAFLSLCLMFQPVVGMGKAESVLKNIEYGETEDLGIPLRTDYILKCAVSTQNGIPIACTTTSGHPATFNVVDLNQGKVIKHFELKGGGTYWICETDSKGNVYFGSYEKPCELYRYTPDTQMLENLGEIPKTSSLISMAFDENDNVYLGTFPNGTIVKYDPVKKQFKDFGKQIINGQYLRAMTCKGLTLYFGEYGSELYQLDLRTGKREKLTPLPYDMKISCAGKMSIQGKYFVSMVSCNYNGKDQDCLIFFDTEKEQWNPFVLEDVYSQYITPEKDGMFYYKSSTDNAFYSFDLQTFQSKKVLEGDTGSAVRGDGWVQIADPDFPGLSYVNVQYNGRMYVINFETGKIKKFENFLHGSPAQIRDMEFGPDGRLYITEFMGTKGAAMDIATKKIEYYHMSQGEGIGVVDDRVIFGTYGAAIIYDLNPFQPFDYPKTDSPNCNPKIAGELGDGQDRPFVVKEADGKAIIGSVPTYGQLGGALSIYDPHTGEKEVYRNIIPDQSVTGLEYKDGIVYGASSIGCGLNVLPTKTYAEIFQFDLKNRKLIKSVVPKLKGLSRPIGGIGDLSFGPDGLLWGITNGLLFAMNPATLDVVKELPLNEPQAASYNQYWGPRNINWDANGLLYISDAGKLKIVDPNTLEYRDMDINCNNGFLIGPDGNLYTESENHIKRTFLYQTDDGKKHLKNRIALFLGVSQCWVNGALSEIDVRNEKVVPYTTEGRTMLPLRFVGESLGADVSWEDQTQTATILLNNKELKIAVGRQEMTVNGEKISLDTPAVLAEGRTMLPLRAVAEAFGKEVFWDDRGLIIISDDSVNLQEEEINKITALFKE